MLLWKISKMKPKDHNGKTTNFSYNDASWINGINYPNDGLVDIGYGKHYRVIHSKDEFARGSSHINGIESFWSYVKHRLKKFHSISKHTFYLHIKECEYRFNLRCIVYFSWSLGADPLK
jgi:ISXO2-like transposase domain